MPQSGVSRSLTCLLFTLLLISPAIFGAQQPDAAAPSPKKPGVKRIGIFTSGNQGDAVREELVSLLQGDGTIVDVTILTSRVDAYRTAEAQRKECDFVLEASFQTKAKKEGGGFLDKARNTVKSVNSDAGNLTKATRTVDTANRKTDSVANISKTLTPDPKDKVQVAYKLYASGAKQPSLVQDKEVIANDLPSYLEKFINDVVTEVTKK